MAINMVLCTDFYDMIDIFSIVQFSNFRGNVRPCIYVSMTANIYDYNYKLL